MTANPVWQKSDDLDSLVEVPVRSSQVQGVRNILRLLGVPEVGPHGGHGFIVGDGAVSISGSLTACQKAVDGIQLLLNGPKFTTADVVYDRWKKGAKPQ